MRIVEIFPNYQKVCTYKDPGQIPFWLAKCGHDVKLVANRTKDNKDIDKINVVKIIKLPKVEIFSISFNLLFYLMITIKQIDCLLLYHLTINTAITSLLYRIFSKKGINIVKLDTDGKTWKPSVPLFFKFYSMFFGETKIIPYVISKTANLLIIESPEARERILKRYPFFREKLVVLPNGVNSELLSSYKNLSSRIRKSKKILYVGQIIHRKGIDILIKAFFNLKDLYPDWVIELVGDARNSAYKKNLQNLILSLDLQERIFFTGHLEGYSLIKKYLESEIFCLPSRYENFPTVILEAMFLGTPVVSSDVGCVEYILDYGQSGLIFKSENEKDLVDKLKIMMEDENLRKSFAEKAEKRCLQFFVWNKICSKLNYLLLTLKQP